MIPTPRVASEWRNGGEEEDSGFVYCTRSLRWEGVLDLRPGMQSAWQSGAPPTHSVEFIAPLWGRESIIVQVAGYDDRNTGLLSESAGLMVVRIHMRRAKPLVSPPTPRPAINPATPQIRGVRKA